MAVSEISSGLVTFSASEGDGYGLPEGRHYSTIVVVPEQKTGCTNGEHGPLCILQFGTINPLKDRRVVLRYLLLRRKAYGDSSLLRGRGL